MGQQHAGDLDVIIDHLPFGESSLGIENFVQVRYLDLFSIHGEFSFSSHGLEFTFSRTTSFGFLSSRRPRKAGCLRPPSSVHSVKRTSQTSSGRSQVARRRWA